VLAVTRPRAGVRLSRAAAAQAAGSPQVFLPGGSQRVGGPQAPLDDELIKQPVRASPAGRVILAVGRVFYVFGTFAAFHLLKRTQLTPVDFLAITLTISAMLLCALHRPWRFVKGRRLTRQSLILCWKTAVCTAAVHWLLIFGLVSCAPVRFLIIEHLEVLVTYCLGMLLGAKQVHGPQVQGGLLIFAGYVVCLWHDTTPVRASGASGVEIDATNTYDSFVGTCAIGLSSFVAVTARRSERQLCVQLGSLKRVHALQASMTLAVVWPLAALQHLVGGSHSMPAAPPASPLYTYPMLLFAAVGFSTLRFALASMQQHLRVPENQALRTSVVVVTSCALGLHTLHSWDTLTTPAVADSRAIEARGVGSLNASWAERPPHRVRPNATVPWATGEEVADASSAMAVYLAAALVWGGVFRFTMEGGGTQLSRLAQRVMPLFELGGPESLMLPVLREGGRTGMARGPAAVRVARQMWRHRATRRPFGYLVASLVFAALELAYGSLAGAPGLTSDAVLVLVDCVAAAVTLAAAHASTRPPSSAWPFGGTRAEVLGGFVNGLLLVVAASGILVGAMRRARPDLGGYAWASERLLIFHVLGLGINACGLALFRDGGSAAGTQRAKRPSQNARGMYLHVLADALGTLVIVASSLARHYSAWTALDPLASLLLACALLMLAAPLLKATAFVLLQRRPLELDGALRDVLSNIQLMNGVTKCKRAHFWCLTPRHEAEGSLHLAVPGGLSAERCEALQGQVAELLRSVEARVLVQLERSPP